MVVPSAVIPSENVQRAASTFQSPPLGKAVRMMVLPGSGFWSYPARDSGAQRRTAAGRLARELTRSPPGALSRPDPGYRPRRGHEMSDLIAIGYPDQAAATRARDNLAEGMRKGLVEVEDVIVIASDDDGRIFPIVHSWQLGLAATSGALAGGLIGLILLGPLLGLAAGGAGALAGRGVWEKTDSGISDQFVNDIWESLTPGSAALIVLVRELIPEKVLPHIHEPGRVIHASVGREVTARLDAALAEAEHTP
jgi:uncharacterized membrane protein